MKNRYKFILCLLFVICILSTKTILPAEENLENIFKKLGFESENYYFNKQKGYWVVGKDEDTYLVYKEKRICLKGIPYNVYRFIDECEKKKIAVVSYLATEKIDWIIKEYPGCNQGVAKATIYFYMPKDEILDFLQECGRRGHKLALETYMSPNYDTICINAAQENPNPEVTKYIQYLKHESEAVRCTGAIKLGDIGDKSAVPALIETLKDENKDVRQFVADALGYIGDKSSVPALIEALTDKETIVRAYVAEALGRIGDKSAIPALIVALKDKEDLVRYEIAEALGDIGDKSAIKVLDNIAKNDKDGMTRTAAKQAIEKIKAEHQKDRRE